MTHHLVGMAEIARMLGVSRQRAHQLAGQPGFPEPVATLAAGKVWETEAVERWDAEHRGHTGGTRARGKTLNDDNY